MKNNRMFLGMPFSILLVCVAVLLMTFTPYSPSLAASDEPIRVACIGDNITFGERVNPRETANYPAQLGLLLGAKYQVRNFGKGGACVLSKGDQPYTEQKEFQQAKTFKPNVVVVLLGTNDSKPLNFRYIDEFETDFKALIKDISQLETKPQIWLCNPVPVIDKGHSGIDDQRLISGIIPKIQKVANETNLPLIDLHEVFVNRSDILNLYNKDNVHPNASGAMFIAQVVYEALSKTSVIRVACMGDSITFGTGANPRETANYPVQLGLLLGAKCQVRNFGKGGACVLSKGDLPYVQQREFQQAKEFNPNIVIILLGTNDSKPVNFKHIGEFEGDYKAFIKGISQLVTRPQIWLCKLVPVLDRGGYDIENQKLISGIIPKIQKVANDLNLPLIDLYDAFINRFDLSALYNKDDVHPNALGARVIAQTVFEALNKNSKEKKGSSNRLIKRWSFSEGSTKCWDQEWNRAREFTKYPRQSRG